MNKSEFINSLSKKLTFLPENEINERVNFYCEMIDDRIEDGASEEDAVSSIGRIDDIVTQIVSEIPLTKIAKERVKPKRRFSTLGIVLISIGSPIWLSLLLSFFAVIFSLYASLWSVIVSFWAVFGSFIGFVFGGIIGGLVFIFCGSVASGVCIIGCGIILAGLSIFAFYGCKELTKLTLRFTKYLVLSTKMKLIKKEQRQ